jgi:hypothetical protein
MNESRERLVENIKVIPSPVVVCEDDTHQIICWNYRRMDIVHMATDLDSELFHFL